MRDSDARGFVTSLVQAWREPSLPRNVAFNWAATAATIAYSLVITPIVVRALDKQLYGIWSFLNGLLTYTDILYLGLGSALIKYVAQYWTQGDRAALNRLGSVVLSIYSVIGGFCLLIALAAAPYVPRVFAEPLDAAATSATTYTTILLGVRILALFVGSVFAGVLVGVDRTDIARVVPISFTVVRFVAVPLFVRGPNPLLALALVIAVSAVLECAVMAWLVRAALQDFGTRWVWPRWPELRLLYGFGLQSFFVLAAVKLISYTDTTVIGVMLGAGSVALYALPLQLIEYGRVGVNGIVAVLLPRLTQLHSSGDTEGLGRAYLAAARVVCIVAAFVNVNLVFLGVPFLRLWVGSQFAEAARWILLLLGAASLFQALSTQVPLPFYQAMHLLRFPAIVLFIEAIVNLTLSILWAPRLGIDGVALATAVPSLCVSFLVLPRHLCRHLRVRVGHLLTHVVLPSLSLICVQSSAFLLLDRFFVTTSYVGLVCKAVAATPAAAAGLAIGLSRGDLMSLLSTVRVVVSPRGWRAGGMGGPLP